MRKQQLWMWLWVALMTLTSPLIGQEALFVSGTDSAHLNNGDQALVTYFQTLGYQVTVKGGSNPAATADATGKDFVFISSTVNSAHIGTTFRDVPEPVIVSETYLLDDMGMVGHVDHVDFGLQNHVSQAVIVDPSSPLAQPLSGTVSVTTANTSLGWGNPPNTATEVAHLTGFPHRLAVFAYHPGDQMVGLTAPGPRGAFFFRNNTAAHATNDAFSLLENLIQNLTSYSTTTVCTAASGTIKINQDPVVLAGGTATITATPQGDAVIPAGYEQVFLLTTGNNLVIQQFDFVPEFTVTATGPYSVHSLVRNPDPNSPDFLDLSTITLGSTTLINVLVSASNVCASIDLAGDDVTVIACTADAGTLTIDQNPVTLANGSAIVSATPDGNRVVPGGYTFIYVLTSGPNLVIEQVSTMPSFTVAAAGDYTIHTLVYNADPNDPNFLDLGVVQFGVTTGVDVVNLVTNNGLCASLDVAGAQV
ncbi:MAG: hypothetical protein AAF804_03885, partial [Bacteroidota bacterium]